MTLSVSSKMIKYLMFGFNFFFVITGIIIIGVGAAVKTVYTEYADFLDTQYFSLPNMLIATGAFIFLVSFFGCCGAIKESWVMLAIFTFFLCIIFVFEFASGIAGYVLRSQTAEFMDVRLRANLDTYTESSHAIWDLIQSNFECCGVDNYTDWRGIFNDGFELPVSCCPGATGVVGAFYCNSASTTTAEVSTTKEAKIRKRRDDPEPESEPESTTDASTTSSQSSSTSTQSPSTTVPYTTGCRIAFGDYVKKHAIQIGGCALGLAIIQVIGIGFSCYLVRQLKNGYSST